MVFRLFLFLINATQAVNTVKLLGIFFFFPPRCRWGLLVSIYNKSKGYVGLIKNTVMKDHVTQCNNTEVRWCILIVFEQRWGSMAQRKEKNNTRLWLNMQLQFISLLFWVLGAWSCRWLEKQRISQGFKCFIASKIRQDSQNFGNQIQVMINWNYPLEKFNSATDLYLTLQEDHFTWKWTLK